jgi:hypothetical protein
LQQSRSDSDNQNERQVTNIKKGSDASGKLTSPNRERVRHNADGRRIIR